ncbi:MAG: hypothetical protein IPJ19_07260 [Planctomycetes bacterium]|nr:hypothetical protein [Planctomycetota bacterium]
MCDSGEDIILRLEDLNADGDANDAGEFAVFFDGNPAGNLSGVVMASANNFCIDATNRFFVATANTSGGGNDAILLLEDLNSDGDANDAGEAREFYTIQPGAPTGDWLPMATAIGTDGAVYYTENGTSSAQIKGIYRLEDLDHSGFIDQPGEANAFFLPPPGPTNNQFHWNLRLDADGWFYIGDTTFERIWRCKDLDGDGDALDPGESVLWWQGSAPSLIWDFDFLLDGSLIACESQTPDRLLVMKDTNCDGLIDASEVATVYDETLTDPIGDPRGIARVGTPGLGATPFCFGDGSQSVPCPCSNNGLCGRGCQNSATTGGARLSLLGTLVPDTAVLTSTGELPSSLSIVLQGNAALAIPVSFGDGVRCAGGTLKRLYVKHAVAGVVSAPGTGDLPLSAQSAALGDTIPPGSMRWYQVYYRDPSPSFCSGQPGGDTWNVSNGLQIRW